MKPLKLVKDPLFVNEIREKIEVLFQEDSFYFYNTKGKDLIKEDDEIQRLISNCLLLQKCYIEEGNLEPIHHTAGERKIIVD